MAKEKDPAKIQLIFNATMNLVLDKGFSGLTMADVAKHAGIATGTLYVYFKNKEDLIDQLYLNVKSQKAINIKASFVPTDSFYANFSRLWRDYFVECHRNPQQMQFVLLFCDSGYISQETLDKVNAAFLPMIAMFEDAQRTMLIVDLPVMSLFAHIMGSTHALVKHHIDMSIPLTPELLDLYFGMTWNGIRK